MPPAYRMPACTATDVARVTAAAASLRGADRAAAEALARRITPRELCRVLHAMRRWYSYNSWNAAKKILPHRAALATAMDLRPPVGAYRGFKVDAGDPLARLAPGARLWLPVARNGGCSSWTAERRLADRFSGGGRGKVGLVVRLLDGRGVQTFIAPPERSAPWFDRLYERAMNRSFRFNEREYAVCAPRVAVEVVAVKRR